MYEGQGHRSTFKVTISKMWFSWILHSVFDKWPGGQRSRGSRSKVTWVKVKGHLGQCQMRVPNKGRWAHINVKLLHFLISAGFCEHGAIIQLLLTHGADPTIKDNDGNTPQDSCENAQLKQLLEPSWWRKFFKINGFYCTINSHLFVRHFDMQTFTFLTKFSKSWTHPYGYNIYEFFLYWSLCLLPRVCVLL